MQSLDTFNPEDENPPQLEAVIQNVDTGRKRGRPKEDIDFRKRLEALEKRVKRAGLELKSELPFKQQIQNIISNDVKALHDEIAAKDKEISLLKRKLCQWENNSICKKLLMLSNSKKPYSQKSASKKRLLRNLVCNAITVNSTTPFEDKSLFVKDFIVASTRREEILKAVKTCLDNEKVASVFQSNILDVASKAVSKSQLNRTKDFLGRKKMQISMKKKQSMSSERYHSAHIELSPNLKVKSVAIPCSSKTDKAARSFIRDSFPITLPKALQDKSSNVESAYLRTEQLVKCIIAMFYCTKELHSHWHWFYSAAEKGFHYNFVQLSTFYDSAPIGKNGEQCTGLYLRILNAPGLIHKPEFIYPLFLLRSKECSMLAKQYMDRYSEAILKMIKDGIELTISGFEEGCTLPKSNIPLNGTHAITFGKNLFAADGKAQLWANGCKGANTTYTPEWRHHKEEMVNPAFPANWTHYISLYTRKTLFKQIDSFRQLQQEAYSKAVAAIKIDKTKSIENKKKDIKNEYNRLMVKSIRQKAVDVKTGCVHHSPFGIADQTSPCPLHLDTNEYLRVLEHIIWMSANLTLNHWDSLENPIHFFSSTAKKGQCVILPNLPLCPKDTPLVKVLD
jgi:hypothetical protein